jgi:hypothetical protein
MKKLILLTFFISFPSFANSSECIDWFKNSKVSSSDKDCLIKCASLETSMATFYCTKECRSLCNTSLQEKILFKYAYYPGLTDQEKAMVAKYPEDAIKVFQQMILAEKRTGKYFPKGLIDDESDAFRHFIWACLLVKELGIDQSQKFLDAHEANPRQTQEAKAMDLANNRAGLLEAQRLLQQKQLDLEHIEKATLEYLKYKKLIILKPSGGKIPEEVLP